MMGGSSTPGHQQLFAEEQHSLHSPLLTLASGWSVNPSHANSGHAVFTSLTSSSEAQSMATLSLERFLISGSRRDRTACLTLMRSREAWGSYIRNTLLLGRRSSMCVHMQKPFE